MTYLGVTQSTSRVTASLAIRLQNVSFETNTLKASLVVNTLAIAANIRVIHALVDINTNFSARRKGVAEIADALETAVHIHAHSIRTHSIERTFIVIKTKCAIWRQTVSFYALAIIAAGAVMALAIQTQLSVISAFIDIVTYLLVWGLLVPWITFALVRTIHVYAGAVRAHVVLFTFVHICTRRPILRQDKTILANADETSGRVLAFSVVTHFINAFILIDTSSSDILLITG